VPAKDKQAEAPKERGRPTRHSKALADRICEQLADGKTLREVCKGEDMPPEATVRRWVLDDREGFAAQYTRAREIGYQSMADELLEISDNGQNDWMVRHGDDDSGWQANGEHLQRSRLRVDTRKWMLSKALPKIYGDKVINTHEAGDSLTEFLGTIAGQPRLK
jgi:hypothetical protein